MATEIVDVDSGLGGGRARGLHGRDPRSPVLLQLGLALDVRNQQEHEEIATP